MNLTRRVLAGLLGAARPAAADTQQPAPILGRYLTLGGAQVHITTHEHPTTPHTRRWTCTGCGDTRTTTEALARHDANTHAGQCRAIPPGGTR